MAFVPQIHNPDDLPVFDPLQQAIERLLFARSVKGDEAAGVLFDLVYRQLGGRPGVWQTTLTDLFDAARADTKRVGSISAVRLGLEKLRGKGLVDIVSQPRKPGLVISLLIAAPDDGQQMLFETRDKPVSPLGLVATKATADLADAAQPRCAAPLRSETAQLRSATAQRDCAEENPPITNKSSASQTASALEIQRGIEAQRRAAGIDVSASPARQLRERSYVHNVHSVIESIDVQNVRNVEKDSQSVNVSETGPPPSNQAESKAHRFAIVADRLRAKLGANRSHPWMEAAAALCLVDGPLSESAFYAAIESAEKHPPAKRWMIFTGAIRNQLHAAGGEACRRSNIVWNADPKRIQFPPAKDRLRALGITWRRFQRSREAREEPP